MKLYYTALQIASLPGTSLSTVLDLVELPLHTKSGCEIGVPPSYP